MTKNRTKILSALAAGTLLFSSCALKPADKEKETEKATTSVKNSTSPINTAGSSNTSNSSNGTSSSDLKMITRTGSDMKASNISNTSLNTTGQGDFLDLPLPQEGSVSKAAMDKYVSSLKELKSDKADIDWVRETGGKEYKGSIDVEANYEEGAPKIMRMYSREGDSEHLTEWYKDKEKIMFMQDGKYKAIPLKDMEDSGSYEFSALVTKALSFKEATEDDLDYTVSIETDDEKFIREAMTYIGYTRDGADDWKSDLVMEVLIDKNTGYLKSITYASVNKTTGDKDSGEIRFSQQDAVEELKMPKEGSEGTTAETQGEVPANQDSGYVAEPEHETEAEYVAEPEPEYVPEEQE